ncbi:hypothetical protein PV325_007685, partial [Microctonus aethiopoides]
MYKLTDDYGKMIEKCHITKLKPYYSDNLQKEQRRNEEEQHEKPRTPSTLLYSGDGRGGKLMLPVPGGERGGRRENREGKNQGESDEGREGKKGKSNQGIEGEGNRTAKT